MQREIRLDVRGRACPVPVLELARAVRQAETGQVILVQASDPAAATDIAAWCDATGNLLIETAREGEELSAWVRKR